MTLATDAATTVVCDMREARSGIAERLRAMPGITVEQAELACGDYAVPDRLIVERKTASDFVLSIQDGRLFEQATRMAASGCTTVLLMEGDPLQLGGGMQPISIVGAQSALTVFFGISILQARSAEQSAMHIASMARHVTHSLGYEIPLRSRKPKNLGLLAQFLAEGLPGVGPTTARKLLEHFGSARELFAAAAVDLQKVKGVGPKTAVAIAEALDARASEWLSTRTR